MTAGLGRCVGDLTAFLSDHWSAHPLHRRGADPQGFDDLLSADDVDRLVSSSLPRVPALRLVRDGRPLDPASYTRTTMLGGRRVAGIGDAGRIWDEFSAGATIVLQALHRSWLPLARFCREIEHQLTHPAQANAYITPPTARGLAVHHDTHDVFVLQVSGRKRWSVHPPVIHQPLRSQAWSESLGPPPPALLDVELAPGDCLYMPRGFPHAARAQDGVSIHVTVGVTAWTTSDVVAEMIRRTVGDIGFRQALPVGFAADRDVLAASVSETVKALQEFLATVDSGDVADEMTRRFWSTRPVVLAGQLHQLGLLDRLDDASRVRRRPSAVCHLSLQGGALAAVLGDRKLQMPAELEPAMRKLCGGAEILVGDLHELDEPSRRVLVRRLVREGLLEVVTTADGFWPPPGG